MHTLKGLKPQKWREWGHNMALAKNIWPESDLEECSQCSEAAVQTEEDAVPLDRGGSGGSAGGIGDSAEDAKKKQAECQERVQESECEGNRDSSVPYLVPVPYPGPDSKLEADPDPDPNSEYQIEEGNEEYEEEEKVEEEKVEEVVVEEEEKKKKCSSDENFSKEGEDGDEEDDDPKCIDERDAAAAAAYDDADNDGSNAKGEEEQEQRKKEELIKSPKKEDESTVSEAAVASAVCSTTSADSAGAQQQSTQAEVRAPKLRRPVFTKTQVQELENVFQVNQYPCTMMRNDLARRMNVAEERIKIWFKNRRARLRRLRIMPSCNSYPMSQVCPETINLERKSSVSFLRKPSHTRMMTDRVPMPSPTASVVPLYSPVLPTAAAPPLYPFPPPACPRPAPPFYPPPFYPPPPAPPIYFPPPAPVRQPQSDVRMTPLPVYSEPVLPRYPSLLGAPWFVYFNKP